MTGVGQKTWRVTAPGRPPVTFRSKAKAVEVYKVAEGSIIEERRGAWDEWRPAVLEGRGGMAFKLHTRCGKTLYDGLRLIAEQWRLTPAAALRRIVEDRLRAELPGLWGPPDL